MKRKITLSVLICLTLALAVSLSACGFIGENGLSAYEIAVQNGFEGTEQEWLDSFYNETTVEQTTNNYYVEGQTDIQLASNTALKSVVSVYCSFTKTSSGNNWFFPQQSQEVNYTSAGSGVVYILENDGSAYIVTNYHVVYDADCNTSNKISDNICVFLYGMEYNNYAIPATYVGGSMYYDVAVLRVQQNELVKSASQNGTLCAANLSNSDNVSAGQAVVAVGNPEAEGISVTNGIISVASENITMTGADNKTAITLRVMRTDTAINSGNSGGGLFNAQGELIGLVNAKMNTNTAENIGYAIPSNLVKAVADNILYYCTDNSCETVMRPVTGITVEVTSVTTVIDENTGKIKIVERLTVKEVSANSPADGIVQVGDVLVSVTVGDVTTQIQRSYHLTDALLNARSGQNIVYCVERGNETLNLTLAITQECLTAN